MAIEFPTSPSLNDTFTAGSITYKWDGAKWIGLGVTPADRLIEGANSLEITAGNDLVWTGGDVGIGIANPNNLLHVYGGTAKIQSDTASSGEYDLLRLQSGPTGGALLKVFADESSDDNSNFTIKTNANENITFEVGTTSPVLSLINGGNVGVGREPSYSGVFGGSQRVLHIGGSAAPCLRITSDTSSQGDFVIHAGNSGGDSVLASLAEGGDIVVYTRQTGQSLAESFRVTSSGNIKLAATKGIDFSAVAGSGISANGGILDDYEEGTWTPVIKSGNNTITYSGGQQRFYYQKIGNHVTVTFSINNATTSGTTGGGFLIEGLPFTSANITNLRTIGTHVVYYGSGLRATGWPNFAHVGSNNSYVDVYTKTATASNYDRALVDSVGADTYVFWQVTYQTA